MCVLMIIQVPFSTRFKLIHQIFVFIRQKNELIHVTLLINTLWLDKKSP